MHADPDGRATDRALAWSVALGSPYTFATTLESEYLSDIVGERAILLGAVHGLVEALWRHFRIAGDDAVTAYERSCENVTGPIARTISASGLDGVRAALDDSGKAVFDRAYAATHGPAGDLVAEIYDEVADGTELRSVILAEVRLADRPMTPIAGSPMWAAAPAVQARRDNRELPIDPLTAGMFVATMTAQVDEFLRRGHPWSEIVNETIIEAVDSLLSYMHARDVALPGGLRADRASRAGTDPADPAVVAAFTAHPCMRPWRRRRSCARRSTSRCLLSPRTSL